MAAAPLGAANETLVVARHDANTDLGKGLWLAKPLGKDTFRGLRGRPPPLPQTDLLRGRNRTRGLRPRA